MSLTIITGKRGGGKTLLMIREAKKASKAGKKVFANFNMKIPHERIEPMNTPEVQPGGAIFLVESIAELGVHIFQDNRALRARRTWLFDLKETSDVFIETQHDSDLLDFADQVLIARMDKKRRVLVYGEQERLSGATVKKLIEDAPDV